MPDLADISITVDDIVRLRAVFGDFFLYCVGGAIAAWGIAKVIRAWRGKA